MKKIKEMLDRYITAVTFIVITGTWELLVRLLKIPEFILPTPSSIVVSLWGGLKSGAILLNLYYTLLETFGGYVIAVVISIILGVLITQFKIIDRALYPYIVAFQSMPKMAIAPLLVIWFGFGLTSKIVMSALLTFFPVLVNTIEGIHQTASNRIDMLKSLGASRWQIFRIVQWPSALPFVFAGLETGIVLALLGAIVGEFVGAQVGLGNLILIENFRMNIAGVFAILIILAVVGVVIHRVVAYVHRKYVFWVN